MSMGNPKVYAVIDCRVSDPQQLKGGSLENQEMAGRFLAERQGWIVDKVFRKPHSATTTERDDIEEIIAYAKSRKKAGVVISKYIFKSIDRFTRMGAPEYWPLKDKLEREGIVLADTTGIIQPKRNSLEHLGGNHEYWWSMSSPSETAEMLAAHQGRQEVRDILTRLVGAEMKLVQEGYAVRRAPDGLKNSSVLVDGKKKIIREPSDRAHFLQKAFEMRANGGDDAKIVGLLNAMGYKTPLYHRWDRSDKERPKLIGKSGGNPLTIKQLQRMIQQTEYVAVIYEKWTRHRPVKAHWDGIVSVDVFNRANRGKIYIDPDSFAKAKAGDAVEVRHNYSPWGKVKRIKDNPEYPWKCILCHHCKSEVLASASVGKSGKKFPAYHCGGSKSGKRAHEYFRIAQDEFEKNVRAYLDSLKFDEGFLALLELHLLDEYRNREKEILVAASSIGHNVADLKTKLANKLDAFGHAKTQTVRDMLEAEIEQIEKDITKAEGERGRIEITEKSIRSFRHYAAHVMEHPSEILTEADNLFSRRLLLTLFFEEIPTYDQILNGTPKLTSLFKLSEEFSANKSQLVTLRGIEPRFTP